MNFYSKILYTDERGTKCTIENMDRADKGGNASLSIPVGKSWL